MALKREENEWKASAMERARKDLRGAPADDAGDGGGNRPTGAGGARVGPFSSSSYSPFEGGGGGQGDRLLERLAEEGPGAEAMRAVGLVRVGGADDNGTGGDPPWTPNI